VPFTAASSSDNMARVVAEKLTAHFKQPFIVDNRPGAGGTIGVSAVAKAPADGYTLLLTTSSPLVINPLIDKAVTYDVERDLAPVGLLSVGSLMLVSSPQVPAKNLEELIALVKKSPGKYSYASNGNGSYSHMSMELFKQMAGLDMVHVPYKGPAQAETDVMGGQVTLMFDSLGTGNELVKSGRLRSYGLSAKSPDPLAPQQKPIAQQGIAALKNFDVSGWSGVMAPRATPQAVVDTLNAALKKMVADPSFKGQMLTRNVVPVDAKAVSDIPKLIRSETATWSALVKSADIRLE